MNISFIDQKKDLYSQLKQLARFLKSEGDLVKFDDFVQIILKSIRIIYSNPEKLLYHITPGYKPEDMLISDSNEPFLLSKESKNKDNNKLLRLSIKVIYYLFKFLKKSRFASFSSTQKYIYLHLIRHLLKESLFEMPSGFKNKFSRIFQVELKEICKIDNFSILRSFLIEIGDYEILQLELEGRNYKNLAQGFVYFIKALERGQLVIAKGFDEEFEVILCFFKKIKQFL